MTIHNLVPETDDILKKVCDPFDFVNPPFDPVQFARDITETMISLNALGLASNQIGVPYRVFALASNPVRVCYNPRIIDTSSEQVLLDEGCLSFPGLTVKVKRPSIIKVRYTLPNGETVTEKFIGMTARGFQHELDHLDGILFYNRANLYHRQKALKSRVK